MQYYYLLCLSMAGGQRNILVVEAEAKSEVGANREEVK